MNKANQEKPNALYGFIYLTSKRGGREKKKEKNYANMERIVPERRKDKLEQWK